MRRSICYTEPKIIIAGQVGNWKFIYNSSQDLPEGTLLKFDLASKGRDFDWQHPQTNLKAKTNLIFLEVGNKKGIPAKAVVSKDSPLPQYEFALPFDVKAGEPIIIHLGTTSEGDPQKNGNRAQLTTFRRRPFYLHIDPKGKGEYKETEAFHLDVRGGKLYSIRIIAPSMVSKNLRFDVIVRFEDAHGNLTGTAPEGTLIEFSYERLRENINWKLFVPETGFINLPNLYFNEPGIYHIKLKNLSTGDEFLSSPIKCFAAATNQVYWGNFHGEAILYDAAENIESCLRHIRDEQAYQFFGTSSFESEEETPSDIWKGISAHLAEFNEDDRFITFLGLQWEGTPHTEGLRQIVYLKDNKPILRKKDSKSNMLKKIYKIHTPKDLFSIPSFTMSSIAPFDFTNFTPEYEKVVEIYNAWGSSECTAAEGNPRPITSKGKGGIKEQKEGSIRGALNRGYRFGFVAGGYDDRGLFASLYESDQVQYTPGLTAILSQVHTRDGLLQALTKRSCYATTGARMVIGFTIAKEPMGSELSTESKPGLAFNRHINSFIVGTGPIKEIEIIRCGKVFKTYTPKDYTYEFTVDDTDPIEKHTLEGEVEGPPFIYYYLRVIQKDGHIAWSSPIWIDHGPPVEPQKGK